MPRIDQIEKMLESEPNDVFLNFALAMEYQKAGRSEDALSRYEQVTQLDPRYVAAYKQRGELLADLGRTDDAREALQAGAQAARDGGDPHAADDIEAVLKRLR